MAPLTVLFGSNSAGKTSIPQLLLLLKQTADSPDRRRALHFGDSRTLVDAGTFDDAVHNHDLRCQVRPEDGWLMNFFRFPRTPHLAWLGEGKPRGDKVLSAAEASQFLTHHIVVEEKVDGANVGISVDGDGQLRLQNRGEYLVRERAHPQFKPLFRWIERRRHDLVEALASDLLLFGEWCYAVHSVRYSTLPDWFLAFDVYDRQAGRFWSVPRRDRILAQLGLEGVPSLGVGRYTVAELKRTLAMSRLGDGLAEGLYIRWDEAEWLGGRAKLVRPEFVQGIGEHWSARRMRVNATVAAYGNTREPFPAGDERRSPDVRDHRDR